MNVTLNLEILPPISAILFAFAILATMEISLKTGFIRPFDEIKGFDDEESVIKRRWKFFFVLIICWFSSLICLGYYLYETKSKEDFFQYIKYILIGTSFVIVCLYFIARPWTKGYDDIDEELDYKGKIEKIKHPQEKGSGMIG